MGQTPHESEQTVEDFYREKTQNSQPGKEKSAQKPEICGIQYKEATILSVTPVKSNESLHVKCKNEGANLPDKYKTLSEFFDCMTTSLRLLSLAKKAPTFRNVSRQVKVLTRREFSYKHLAQIKFIFPEAVQIKKILIHDEKTMCMEPEMKINLVFDAIEGLNEKSDYIAMQRLFSSRLFKYSSIHTKGCEIPEAELPEPFNKKIITIATDVLAKDLSTESLSETIDPELLNSSHMCPSFSRHFSTEAIDVKTEKSQLLPFEVPLSSTTNDFIINQDTGGGQQEPSDLSMEPFTLEKPCHVACPPKAYVHESTPLKVALENVNLVIETPATLKVALENDNLVIETPAQATPKRSVSSDNKPRTEISQKWVASNISVKRSLDSKFLESEELFLDSKADTMENTEGETKVEESSSCASKDAVSNEDELMPHQQKPAYLSDLVSTIHHIFQSTPCSSITQQELVHKIMMNNLDVVDSREVEEQLGLLEKLVPDWISKNVTPSEDILYRIKNVPDLNSVRENLI